MNRPFIPVKPGLLLLLCGTLTAAAQVQDPVETTKQKGEDRLNGRIEGTVDRGLDKLDQGLDGLFRKKEKKHNAGDRTGQPSAPMVQSSGTTPDFDAYRKSDFVPGSNILFFDDFSNTRLLNGMPEGWKGNGTCRIEQLEGINWLVLEGDGGLYPLNVGVLPDNFTLELDVMVLPEARGFPGTFNIRFLDKSQQAVLDDPYMDDYTQVSLSAVTQVPGQGSAEISQEIGGLEQSFPQHQVFFKHWHRDGNRKARIALARQGQALSVYINEVKIWDNVNAFHPGHQLLPAFHLQSYFIPDTRFLITNVRLAGGSVNAAASLQQGSFSTNAIYFDVGKARIRPESYPVLKAASRAIAAVQGTVMITGHTDSNGSDAANLELSRKRAAAVKEALVSEFGANPGRLLTDGKGAAEPADKNTTAGGRANNRRVVFTLQ